MAKFTKTNKAIHHDGTIDFTDNQSMGGDYTDPNSPIYGNRMINAAPGVDDHDYIIKKQAFTIIDDNDPNVVNGIYNLYVSKTGDDNNDGLSEETAWETPQRSVSYLSNKLAADDVEIIVNIGAGDWNNFEEYNASIPLLNIKFKDFGSVTFKGSDPINFKVISITLDTINPIDPYTVYLVITVSDTGNLLQGIDITNNPHMSFQNSFSDGLGFTGPTLINEHGARGSCKIISINADDDTLLVRYSSYNGKYYSPQGALGTGIGRVISDKYPYGGTYSGSIRVLNTSFSTGTHTGTTDSIGSAILALNSNVNSIQNIVTSGRNVRLVQGGYGFQIVGSNVNLISCQSNNVHRGVMVTQSSRGVVRDCHISGCVAGFITANTSFLNPDSCGVMGCSSGYSCNITSSLYVNTTDVSNCYRGYYSVDGASIIIAAGNADPAHFADISDCYYGVRVNDMAMVRMAANVQFFDNDFALYQSPDVMNLTTGSIISNETGDILNFEVILSNPQQP